MKINKNKIRCMTYVSEYKYTSGLVPPIHTQHTLRMQFAALT